MNDTQEKYLKRLYYSNDGEASYGSLAKLYAKVKRDGVHNISKGAIKQYLLKQEVFTTNRHRKRQKGGPSIVVSGPNKLIEIDTAYFPRYGSRYKHYVLGIDGFSRKVATQAVTSLKADAMKNAVRQILNKLGQYSYARTDRGSDLTNKKIKALFAQKNITQYYGYQPNKSALAERAIKSISAGIHRRMQHFGDKRWVRFLQPTVTSYNQTIHGSTGRKPNDVTDEQSIADVWFNLKHKAMKKQAAYKQYKYNINDGVRIFDTRLPLQKEYDENASVRIYYISNRYKHGTAHIYSLKDDNNNMLPGRFTPDQLTKVITTDQTEYRIQRILKSKRTAGILYHFIDWLGYPAKYRSWVRADSVRDLRRGDN